MCRFHLHPNPALTPDVSIIVVSYNTSAMTCACLASVLEQTRRVRHELLVVDNGSTDGSPVAISCRFPRVSLAALRRNVGFAAANNLAARGARGRWLLFLNPDTVVLDGAIDRLLAFAHQHPEADVFGGRTLFADGSLNATSCWGRPTLWSTFCFALGLSALGGRCGWFDTESMRRWRRDSVRCVDVISGCFLLIRRELWLTLGGFDERFFMYGEDFDLCMRARARGATCLFCPDAAIVHHGGASERVKASQMVRQMAAKRALMLKHWGSPAAAAGVLLLQVRVAVRACGFGLLSRVKPALRDAHRNWSEVWSRRNEWCSFVNAKKVTP